jgi:precorrin-2 methylase
LHITLIHQQKMKKLFALAFVAGMVSFASCTSKPAEETTVDSSAIVIETPEVDTLAADTNAVDTTVVVETPAN